MANTRQFTDVLGTSHTITIVEGGKNVNGHSLINIPYSPSETTGNIRYNNPGAMYPDKYSYKFGAREYGKFPDGNLIAFYPSYSQGIAGCLYKLYNSKHFVGKTYREAFNTWSGGLRDGTTDLRGTSLTPDDVIVEGGYPSKSDMLALAKGMFIAEGGTRDGSGNIRAITDNFNQAYSVLSTIINLETATMPEDSREQIGSLRQSGSPDTIGQLAEERSGVVPVRTGSFLQDSSRASGGGRGGGGGGGRRRFRDGSSDLGIGPNITNIGMQSILQLAPDLAAEAIQSRIPNAPGLSSLGSEIVSSLSSGQEVSSIMDSIRKLTSATSTQDRANVLLEILQENQQFIQQQMNRRGMSIPTSLISDYLPMMDDFELMDSKNRALMLVDMARRIDPQMVPKNIGSSLDESQRKFIQGLLKPGLDVNTLTVEQFLDENSYNSKAEGQVSTVELFGKMFGADADYEMLQAIQENIQGDPTKLLQLVILQSASEKLPNAIVPDYQQPVIAEEEKKGFLGFNVGPVFKRPEEEKPTIPGQNTLEEAGGFRPELFELKLYDPDLKKLAESIPVILKEDIDQILETPIAKQYLDQRVSLETGELTYKNVLDAVLTEDERGMVRFVSDVGEMVTGFESRDIETIIRGTNDEQRQKELRASVGGKVLDDYITSNPTLKSIIDFFSSNKELMILLGSTAGISALSGLMGGGMFGGALAGAGGVAATRFIFGEEGFSDLMSTLNSAATPAFDFIQNIFDESGISDIPILGDMLGGVMGLGRDNPVAALSALTGNFGGAAGILAGTAGVNLFDGKTSFNAMMESLSDSVPAGANQIVKDLAIAFGRPPSNDYTEVMGNNTSGSNPNGSPGMTGLFHPDDKVFTSDNPGNMSSAAAGL